MKYDLNTAKGRAGFLCEVPREELLDEVLGQLESGFALLAMIMHIDGVHEDEETLVTQAWDALGHAIDLLDAEANPRD